MLASFSQPMLSILQAPETTAKGMSLEVRLDCSGSHLDDLLNVVELAVLCLTCVNT